MSDCVADRAAPDLGAGRRRPRGIAQAAGARADDGRRGRRACGPTRSISRAGLRAHGVETTLAVLGPPRRRASAPRREAIAGLASSSRPGCRSTGRPSSRPRSWRRATRSPALARSDRGRPRPPEHARRWPPTRPFRVPSWRSAIPASRPGGRRCAPGRCRPISPGGRGSSRAAIAPADALVAPTRSLRGGDRSRLRPAGRPRVVHNGRRARAASRDARRPAYVFTAGRLWDEGKNLAALDRAAARLALAGPRGGTARGAERRPRRARARPDARPPRAPRGGAGSWPQRPIFVSAARYEPFGLAVLEAAQAGCALVLSRHPDLPRAVGRGGRVRPAARTTRALAGARRAPRWRDRDQRAPPRRGRAGARRRATRSRP